MNNCNHIWIGNRGSNDKPCEYCYHYPALRLRYKCSICLIEVCKICLDERNVVIPPIPEDTRVNRSTNVVETRSTNVVETRVLSVENKIEELEEKIKQLTDKIESFAKYVIYLENDVEYQERLRKAKHISHE